MHTRVQVNVILVDVYKFSKRVKPNVFPPTTILFQLNGLNLSCSIGTGGTWTVVVFLNNRRLFPRMYKVLMVNQDGSVRLWYITTNIVWPLVSHYNQNVMLEFSH